jgi:hypothetical protein
MLNRLAVLATVAAIGSAVPAFAALKITEVMAQVTAGTATTINGDWWELTNTGSSAVDLTGYAWADVEDIDPLVFSPNGFPSMMLAPGESLIVLDEPSANLAAWRTNWSVPSGLVVLAEDNMIDLDGDNDIFSGLGATNDAVYLLAPTTFAVVDQYVYATSTRGVTANIGRNGSLIGVSVVGQLGAYRATNNDIGSPGITVVPEPTAMALLLPGLALLARRR